MKKAKRNVKLGWVLLAVLTIVSVTYICTTVAEAVETLDDEEPKLADNQAYLYYMYKDETGHYLLDPSAEYENVIYVSPDMLTLEVDIHHGTRFIGKFADETKWDLIGLKAVIGKDE